MFEDTDKDHFESRVVITGKRLIQALFGGPRGNPLGQRFLDFFALVEPTWVNETLLASLPDGYKRDFEQKTKDALISEMVPVGQSVSNWTEMVTVQVFYALKTTPQQFKAQMEKERAAACPEAKRSRSRKGMKIWLPLDGVAAELSAQQSHRQARDHLVQGDRGK